MPTDNSNFGIYISLLTLINALWLALRRGGTQDAADGVQFVAARACCLFMNSTIVPDKEWDKMKQMVSHLASLCAPQPGSHQRASSNEQLLPSEEQCGSVNVRQLGSVRLCGAPAAAG